MQHGFSRRSFMQFGALGAVGLGIGSAAACSSPGGGQGQSATEGALRYLSEDTADVELDWYTKVSQEFEERYTQVNGEHLSTGEDFYQKLQTLFASQNPPDIIPMTGANRGLTLWNEGVLAPLNDLVDEIGADRFAPGTLERCSIGSDVYTIPYTSTPTACWFRKDLIGETSVSELNSWDDLLTYARDLTDANEDRYGFAVPLGRNSMTNLFFYVVLRSGGGHIVDPDLNVVLDSPETLEALEFIRELSQYSPPGSENFTFADLVSNFVSGRAASTYYMGRILQQVNANAPEMAADLGATTIPVATGVPEFLYNNLRGAVVPADAERPDLAQLWLTEFQYEPSLYIEWLNLLPGHNNPLLPEVESEESFTSEEVRAANTEIMDVLQRTSLEGNDFILESSEHTNPNPAAGELEAGTILSDMVQAVLIQNADPQESVSAAASQIADVIERLQG